MLKHVVVDNVKLFFADKELSKKIATKNEIKYLRAILINKINLLVFFFCVSVCGFKSCGLFH